MRGRRTTAPYSSNTRHSVLQQLAPRLVPSQVSQLQPDLLHVAVPRAIREALVSWDRTLYDIPIIEPEKPAPGVLYERIYDLGASRASCQQQPAYSASP